MLVPSSFSFESGGEFEGEGRLGGGEMRSEGGGGD